MQVVQGDLVIINRGEHAGMLATIAAGYKTPLGVLILAVYFAEDGPYEMKGILGEDFILVR